jgi:methylenetetrahydrofolate--tRNA-(uracil-5-)-methyltransferase
MTVEKREPIHVIGAGLAGSEAAWQIASSGVPVVLHEMRPVRMTDAHKTDGCAELVCSNSFRSDDAENNAVGLLHAEMRRAGSLIMSAGDKHKLPAGGALAVDRDGFSAEVTARLAAHPLITVDRSEVAGLPRFSMRSHRSFISTRLISISRGASRVTTRPVRAARAPIISTARWTRRNTMRFSMR